MIDLQTQLARYGDFHNDYQAPLTVEEVLAGVEESPVIPRRHLAGWRDHPQNRRRRRIAADPSLAPWAIVAVAILVVLLLAVIPIWLSGGGPDPVEPAPPVTTTLPVPPEMQSSWPAIEPADLNMAVTSLGTLRWTRVRGDVETLPAGALESDPSGDGFVIHDVENGTVWLSSDGLTWEHDPDAIEREPGEWTPIAVSADGAGWSLPDSIFPEGATIFATDFGWVATAMPQNQHVFAISSNGESWEVVPPPPGPPFLSGEGTASTGAVDNLLYVSLSEVDSGSRTLWIGTIEATDEDIVWPPDTWPVVEPTVLDRSVTSLGTLSWTRVSGDVETLPGSPIVADGKEGYRAGDQDQGVWSSPDGLHWTRNEDEAGLPVGPGGASGVFETSFGFVRTSMPQSQHLIAISADGETWEEVSGPPGSHEPMGSGMTAAGAAGDLIWVLVDEESGLRTIWIGRFDN